MIAGDLRFPETAPDAHRRLIEIASEQTRLAAEAAAILADLASAPASSQPAAPSAPADRWLDSTKARRVAGVTTMTLTRWARRYGIGEKTTTGVWRYSERKLRDLIESQQTP